MESSTRLLNATTRSMSVSADLDPTVVKEQYSTVELQQLFSNICHELQSPLHGILGNLDLLKTTIASAKEKSQFKYLDDLLELLTESDDYIHGIEASTNHQLTVTGKILSITKLDAGKVILRQKLFSPRETVNDIVSIFKANLNINQKMIVQLPVDDLFVEGDETQLKQIIINLLNNAIKFTPQGTITLTLACKPDSGEDCYLYFTVQDTGIGMSDVEQDNLFKRYSQANKYIIEKFGGSGLGLAICKNLVELMGGTLTVRSKKGHGTTFSFSVRCQSAPSALTEMQVITVAKPALLSRSVVSNVMSEKEAALTLIKASGKVVFNSKTDCGQLINSRDWSMTALGSVENWPRSLISSMRLCLASPFLMSIWWGHDFTLLYNDAYRSILGSKHPSALGANGLKVWEEDAPTIQPLLKSIMLGGDAVLFEDVLYPVARDTYTEECYFDIAYSALFDDGNDIAGVMNIATEKTKAVVRARRMSLLRELSKASELNSTELVCQLIAQVLTKYCNDAPFSLLYLHDESQNLILRSCTGVLPNSTISPAKISRANLCATIWALQNVIETRQMIVMEDLPKEWALPGGIWPEPAQQAVVLPILTSTQKILGIFVCGISPRQRFDEDYKIFVDFLKVQIGAALDTATRAEQLVDLDKAKTAFFTNISHEFRTPLALMLGPLADSLDTTKSPLTEEQYERQLLIQRNAQRLLKLVNTLLEFSRLEAGRVDILYASTNLTTLTREICNTFSSVMKEADIDFVLDMQTLERNVYIDKDMWEKIILNLLSNAFKFTLKGQITVALKSLDSKVCLTVQDTGVGIPQKDLPRIFERFHRINNSQGRSFEGSGIGLAFIQELVKLHKGTISVTSTLDQGSCFTIVIPYGSGHLPSDKVAGSDEPTKEFASTPLSSDNSWEAVSAELDDSLPPDLTKPRQFFVDEIKHWQAPEVTFKGETRVRTSRVLLVDDNADMRSYIGNILKQHWEVELAVDGLQALELAFKNPPDLVLSDIMMPKVDGLELIKRLRKDPRTNGVPIILLSARAGDQAKVEGLDTGADDYLIKTSFSEKELLARVRNHIELGRLRRGLEVEVLSRTEELRELNAALYEFIDMICHEVRNPLHGIVGNCELLKELLTALEETIKGNIPPSIENVFMKQTIDVIQYLANIEECVHHQTTMLDEVILLTKLDAKKIEFVNIVCEPSIFLSSVMHTFKSKINSKGIKIVLNPIKEGSKIMTDPRCVNQILNGLLANVIENSAQGSEIAVTQSLKIEDDRLKLESNLVCTCVDIDEKTFSALINTFSQINVGVGQNYTKSRFSLAISNKLVGLMGGDKITITKDGTGETGFTFTVICQKAEELFSVLDSAPSEILVQEILLPVDVPPRVFSKRALVVEDNLINQTLCKALLKKQGFESVIANNGQEAVDLFKPDLYDFILMDIAMPIMTGIQATREIRKIEGELNVTHPVIIIGLSAYSQEDKINEASDAGMNDYISKPATFKKIVNIISQWAKPTVLRKKKSKAELFLQNSLIPKSEAVVRSMLAKPTIPLLL